MDDSRFDEIAARVAFTLNRRRGLGLLAGASLPLTGLTDSPSARSKKAKKVTLCVNGQTVSVPKKKAKKLLQKGATKGNCASRCPSGQKVCQNRCIRDADCCNCRPGEDCLNGRCVAVVTTAAPRCGNGGPCVVFQGQGVLGSVLSGLTGADVFCTTIAEQNPALAGRPFKAWLSGGGLSPSSRFTNTANAGPYVLVGNASDNGNPPPTVAASFAALVGCQSGGAAQCLTSPIARDHLGSDNALSAFTWTGTLENGTEAAETCDAWTDGPNGKGSVGETSKTTSEWTNAQGPGQACSGTVNGVYCFEQPT